jgi:hypothetical protein
MFDEHRFLDKKLRPLSLEEWGKLFENIHYKRVDLTRLWWGGEVSTVWLGLNHQFLPDKPPLIFETMVFGFGREDLFCERFTNIETAERRHLEIVREFRNVRYFFLAIFLFTSRYRSHCFDVLLRQLNFSKHKEHKIHQSRKGR